MAKLMRKRKRFGRCACCGHGANCEVSREIQSIPAGRAADKREVAAEIAQQPRQSGGTGDAHSN